MGPSVTSAARQLAPHTVKRRRIKIDGIYDIECGNWTDFVCGGYLRTSDGAFFLYSEHESADPSVNSDAMATAVFCNGGVVWAHSGGTYDHKWLIDKAARRGYYVAISAAGARIVTAQIGKLHLRDSWALCPISLADLTASQGIAKQKLDLPCICEKDCGGYCSISRTMPIGQYRRLTEYLEADCKSLHEALLKVQDFADENDLDLGPTVGSSAWRTIKRWLGVPDAQMDGNEHAFARGGYYGGRVQIPLPGEHYNVNEYDVSAMYPWSMKAHPMPVGEYRMRYGSDARAAVEDKAGIYDVVIDVPPMHLPPLPVRTSHRTAYPTGRLRGTWALPEILYAQSLGARIVDVVQGITWDRTELIFAPFVDEVFRLRDRAGKKTPMGIFLKFYQNAPYGKLGSAPEKERFFVNPKQLVKCPGNGPCVYLGARDCGRCCAFHCNRRCGAMAEHSDYIWSEYAYKLDPCAHIEWAAYITSYARIEWHRQAVSIDDGLHVIYGDTDSIHTTRELLRRLGSQCGEWEYKGKSARGVFIAPKTYYLERDGKIIAHAKGLHAPKDKPIVVGKLYEPIGVVGLKHGAKLGVLFTPNSAITSGRRAQFGTGDRVLLPDGTTRAPTIDELVSSTY